VPQGREAFIEYTNTVCAELSAKIGGPAIGQVAGGDTVAIFGHAVFLNAVAYVIADHWGVTDLDSILDADLGEAEALVIEKSARSVNHLKP
jgi:predicted SnoaL-like aldol condensation-catalyzing enzyme